ncbi:MAG: GGDEF domain-containing protein [Acutalibacteraceae bacterium]
MEKNVSYFTKLKGLRKFYFSDMRGYIMHDNLAALCFAAVASEVILAMLFIFALFAFHNSVLDIFYIAFLLCDAVIIAYSKGLKSKKTYTYEKVRWGCTAFVLLIMGFILGISIFTSKTDVAIFWPLVYILSLILFQFPIVQTVFTHTAFTVALCVLSITLKSPHASPYDVMSAAVTWVCGFVFLVIFDNMRIKNGELSHRLEQESITDYLTGLYNRRGMDKFFPRTLKSCKLSGVSAAVFIVDIDNFKKYNDKFGHTAGDEHLSYIGRALLEFAEETGAYSARYGGEEFVMIIANCGPDSAKQRGEELLSRLRRTDSSGNTLTVSIGASVNNPTDGDELELMISQADKALYESKRNGKNCLTIYSSDNKLKAGEAVLV